jgi:hypothetical protein
VGWWEQYTVTSAWVALDLPSHGEPRALIDHIGSASTMDDRLGTSAVEHMALWQTIWPQVGDIRAPMLELLDLASN